MFRRWAVRSHLFSEVQLASSEWGRNRVSLGWPKLWTFRGRLDASLVQAGTCDEPSCISDQAPNGPSGTRMCWDCAPNVPSTGGACPMFVNNSRQTDTLARDECIFRSGRMSNLIHAAVRRPCQPGKADVLFSACSRSLRSRKLPACVSRRDQATNLIRFGADYSVRG